MNRKPLNESSIFRPIGVPKVLTERTAANGGPIVEVTGVFQNYLDPNRNGRVYPRAIWEGVLNKTSDLMQKIGRRGVLGVLEHPEDGVSRINESSHVITDVRFATPSEIKAQPGILREGDILGTYECLGTLAGRDLRALHEGRVEVGISSRGSGSTINRGSYEEVCDDYMVETWDIVANPSVIRATPIPIMESEKPVAAPINESTDAHVTHIAPFSPPNNNTTTNMSKLVEFKKLKGEALRLLQMESKSLRPTEVATLVESIEGVQLEAQVLAGQDPTLVEAARDLSTRCSKRLIEMDEEFDAPPVDEVPAGKPPSPPDGGPDTSIDEVAGAALDATIAYLRTDESPEALELADALEDVQIAHAPEVDGEVSDTEIKDLPESVQVKIRGLRTGNRLLLKQHSRLSESTTNLLERFKQTRSKLAESTGKTISLATYNKNTLELAHKLTEAKLPALYAANAAKLNEAKTLEAFENIVESALKPAAPKADAPSRTPARRVNESVVPAPATRSPAVPAPAVPIKPAAPTALHESVSMVKRGRMTITDRARSIV